VSHSGICSLIPSSPAARQGSVRRCSALVTQSPDRSGPAHSFPTLRFFPGHEMNSRLRSGEHTLPHSGPPCGCAPRFAVVLVLGPVLIRQYNLLHSGYFTDPGPLDRLLCSRSGPAPWRRGSGPRLTSGMARGGPPSIWLRTRVSAKPDTQHAEKLTPASGRSCRRFPVCRVNRSASVVVPLIPQRYSDTFKDPTYIHAILHDRASRGDVCNLPENG